VSQSEADRYAAIVAPFLDRLEAQTQRIGHLEAELAFVTAQRDRLQASPTSPHDAGSNVSEAVAAAPEESRCASGRAHRSILVFVAVVEAAPPVGAMT
jgi:hypothetical protein